MKNQLINVAMRLIQVANLRNPGWVTERQFRCCADLFDETDPDLRTDAFREFPAEELYSYFAREYAKQTPEIRNERCDSKAQALTKTYSNKKCLYTIHTAFNKNG